ncbi:hypothetical protein FrEUN1fDRAFT_6466 [Parafrankia sp. EUN1f]|nr:hypothetical protein FrEUN1fDRAFT_6466 [Parafrankia sp. EUN1f]
MIGLAGIGAALVLGVGMRAAAVTGATLLVLCGPRFFPRRTTPSWTTT